MRWAKQHYIYNSDNRLPLKPIPLFIDDARGRRAMRGVVYIHRHFAWADAIPGDVV